MVLRFTRMHILLSLLYSAELGNNFLCISVSEGSHSVQTGKSCAQMETITELANWCHCHDVTLIQHMNAPSMTSAFQQGKPMQWNFVKGREMGSSLSSDSPFEQPPRSVKRYMLCQKLYLNYIIKLVKLCSKKLGYGSLSNFFSTTTGGCLHII